jgi:hypothetical protein
MGNQHALHPGFNLLCIDMKASQHTVLLSKAREEAPEAGTPHLNGL